jgi:hypothetical protein
MALADRALATNLTRWCADCRRSYPVAAFDQRPPKHTSSRYISPYFFSCCRLCRAVAPDRRPRQRCANCKTEKLHDDFDGGEDETDLAAWCIPCVSYVDPYRTVLPSGVIIFTTLDAVLERELEDWWEDPRCRVRGFGGPRRGQPITYGIHGNAGDHHL